MPVHGLFPGAYTAVCGASALYPSGATIHPPLVTCAECAALVADQAPRPRRGGAR